MIFKKLEYSDINTVKPYLYKYAPSKANDFTLTGLFLWRDFLDCYMAIEDDGLFIYQLVDGKYLFYLPFCENVDKGIDKIIAFCKEQGCGFGFYPVSDDDLKLLEKKNIDFVIEQKDDYSDYVYLIDELANLNGKKFHSHKNHVNKFNKTYPDYKFAKLTKDDLNGVYSLIEEYKKAKEAEGFSEIETEELNKLPEILNNPEAYNLFGYCLFVNGAIEGLELGEIVGDMYYSHIEKANRSIEGIYSKMINAIALDLQGQVVYMNREEDLGEAGLRTAKTRLNPCGHIKKNMVFVL